MRRSSPLLALAALLLLATSAYAQTQPPPLSPQPAAPTPPPAAEPPVPPPATTPAVPAGPEAPAAGLPTLTPEPTAPPPPLALEPPKTTPPPQDDPDPFYTRAWFWGTVGVVVATAVIILIATSSDGPGTPNTTLGNMHAF